MEINKISEEEDDIHDTPKFIDNLNRFKEQDKTNRYVSTVLRETMSEFDSRQKSYLTNLNRLIKCFTEIKENIEDKIDILEFLNVVINIYEKEQQLHEDIEKFTSTENFEEFLNCFIKYNDLFDLYSEEADYRKEKSLREFWNNENLKLDMFYLMKYHVHILNALFPRIRKNCQEMAVTCPGEVDTLQEKTKKVFDDVEIKYAIGEIADKISLEEQGKLLHASRFLLRYEFSWTFRGIILLFEKSVVFTKESVFGACKVCTYYTHIPLEYVDLKELDDNQLEINRFQNGEIRGRYIVMHADKIHGNLDRLIRRLKDQLEHLFNYVIV